jgi:inhibitor of cysteine peptidase
MTEILIGEGHNGASISAKAGDVLLIKLPENPTTGFRWNVTEADPRLLQLQADDFVADRGAGTGGGR